MAIHSADGSARSVRAIGKIKQRRRSAVEHKKKATDFLSPTDCAVCLNLWFGTFLVI